MEKNLVKWPLNPSQEESSCKISAYWLRGSKLGKKKINPLKHSFKNYHSIKKYYIYIVFEKKYVYSLAFEHNYSS